MYAAVIYDRANYASWLHQRVKYNPNVYRVTLSGRPSFIALRTVAVGDRVRLSKKRVCHVECVNQPQWKGKTSPDADISVFFFKHTSDNFILFPEVRYTKTKCSGFIFTIAIADFCKENLINKRKKNRL